MPFDVIIGGSYKEAGNSAAVIFKTGLDLYQNRACYFAYNLIIGLEMVVFKSCPEGTRLTTMLEDDYASEQIKAYLDELALERVEVSVLHDYILRSQSKAFQGGRASKLKEINETIANLGLVFPNKAPTGEAKCG